MQEAATAALCWKKDHGHRVMSSGSLKNVANDSIFCHTLSEVPFSKILSKSMYPTMQTKYHRIPK